MLLIHGGLLAWASSRNSPVIDEVGHLPAGVSHWCFGRFDLYRVNPPLVRSWAALPVLASDCVFDWTRCDDSPTARPEFAIGRDVIARNGERVLGYFTLARWMCIPFSLLGGYVCYLWSSELYGRKSGVLAAVLWCFSPNILAHAALITPDAGAAAFGVAAGYAFWRWLRRPSLRATLIAGGALGLKQVSAEWRLG
jgi:hypothetical protein